MINRAVYRAWLLQTRAFWSAYEARGANDINFYYDAKPANPHWFREPSEAPDELIVLRDKRSAALRVDTNVHMPESAAYWIARCIFRASAPRLPS